MRKTPHTSAMPGTRVSIKLHDDTIVVGKFKERTGKFIVLYDGQRFRTRDIRSFMIVKGKGSN